MVTNKKIAKSLLYIFITLVLTLANMNIANVRFAHANPIGDAQKITVNNDNVELCGPESNICFFDEDRVMAEMEVLKNDVKIDHYLNEETNKIELLLPEYTEDYDIAFSFMVDGNFEITEFQVNDITWGKEQIPGDNIIHHNVTSSQDLIINALFSPFHWHGGEDDPGHPPHHRPNFEIIAELEGVSSPLLADESGNFIIPTSFTGGNAQFRTKVCNHEGHIVADNGQITCDAGTDRLEPLRIEGMLIKGDVDKVFSVSEDRHTLTIKNNFFEYARAGLHLLHDEYMDLNFRVYLTTEDAIVISAKSDLSFEFDIGSLFSAEAFFSPVTTEGDISIFFGNTTTRLEASGKDVARIIGIVKGNGITHPDGSAEIFLPPLSNETTSKVSLKILLLNGEETTKDINIIRTAFRLHNYPDHGRVEASYIVHKAYLYNNQNHNKDIFDAYLQVLFYRGDVVIGYKQIQIDDEDFVNSLEENESGEMFAGFGNITLYNKEEDKNIVNPTKISAFLTNGKIKYGEKLPSVEFGIGSGVTIDLGGKK